MSDGLQRIINELQGMRTDLGGCIERLDKLTVTKAQVQDYITHASLADCAEVIEMLVERVSDDLGTARALEDAKEEIEDHLRDIEEPPLCGACNGSGEGQHDGTRCRECKGSGVSKQER